MKRFITLMLALILFALPALAEPMGQFDYVDDLTETGAPIYYFEDLSLQLPVEWLGKVIVFANENSASFYQRDSYDKYLEEGLEGGGFLFSLGACVNDSFTELPSYKYLGFSENSCMNYYIELPTDYPAYMDDAIRAEYDMMSSQIEYIVEHVDIYPERTE